MGVAALIVWVAVLGAQRRMRRVGRRIHFAHVARGLRHAVLRADVAGERELRGEYQDTQRQCCEPSAIFSVEPPIHVFSIASRRDRLSSPRYRGQWPFAP